MHDSNHHYQRQMPGNALTIESTDTSASAPTLETRLEEIRCRLRTELPSGPYLTDFDVALVMGISAKRLQNLRAEGGENLLMSHPPFVVLKGRRGVRYPREGVIDFFARQELEASGRCVHRCL